MAKIDDYDANVYHCGKLRVEGSCWVVTKSVTSWCSVALFIFDNPPIGVVQNTLGKFG